MLNHCSKAYIISLLCIFSIGIFLRLNYFSIKSQTPDEYQYQSFATEINRVGLSIGVKNLINQFQNESWRWNYPTPSRVGVYLLDAISQQLNGETNQSASAYVSTLASLLTLLIVTLAGYIIAGPALSIFAGLLYAVSPLSLALARRGWSDSLVELLMSILLLAAIVISKNKKVTALPISLFVLSGIYSFLVKESALLMLAVTSLFVTLHLVLDKNWRQLLLFLSISLFTVILGISLLSYLVGGTEQLFLIYSHMRGSVSSAPYATTFQSGPWYDFLKSFFILSPALSIFLTISFLACLFKLTDFESFENKTFVIRSFLGLIFILVIFTTIAALPDYYKNLRYLSPLYPIIALIAAAVPASFFNKVHEENKISLKRKYFIALCCFLIICLFDFARYKKIIVEIDCQDLNLKMLRICAAAPLQ